MQMTTTENGAVSLATTNDDRVNLFFKAVRFTKVTKNNWNEEDNDSDCDSDLICHETNYENIFNLIINSWKSYPLDTLKILYNWRDCRGGKGDRHDFLNCLAFLYSKYPEWIIQNLKILPEYGRFLDLIELYHMIDDSVIEQEILNIFVSQIDEDIQNLEKGQCISLAAKWIPRENGRWDKGRKNNNKKRFYMNFCKEYKNKKGVKSIDLKYIRQEILGPLKKHLKLVETLIAEKRYNEINYETVPSIAMKNYRKLFEKYDSDRFYKYLSSVQKGEKKINSSQLYPHDIINSYSTEKKVDIVLEEQWKNIKNKVNETKAFHNSLCVVDVSGSMDGTPMDVAIALGLLSTNETNNHSVITFHSEPEFIQISDSNLFTQIKNIKKIDWGMNTNIERVFDLVFGMSIEGKVIEKIFIFSDMQFDAATTIHTNNGRRSKIKVETYDTTHHEKLKQKFQKAGLTLPTIIYWNLRADTNDFPVKCNENGVVLMSGYSPSLLTNIINGEDINPLNVVLSIINNERYNLIQEPLQ
jgi:hypothetical protein